MRMRLSHTVRIGNLKIGGENPVVIQSMTNTDTADVKATTGQVINLFDAGAEMVRVAVNNTDAALAVPKIKENLLKKGYLNPLIGDFHYNGHVLLKNHPDCAASLDKYRINPGNVGFGESREYNFKTMIETALKNNKPVRIGVNWGSLDQSLFQKLTEENSKAKNPKNVKDLLHEALVQSALNSAAEAEKTGMPPEKIVLSAKMSEVTDVITTNQMLAERCSYAIHLGLTEAGMGDKGIVASVSALAVLLKDGIGDTIRVSITPRPGQPRAKEVEICRLILQTMGLRQFGPMVTSCPGCGRADGEFYLRLGEKVNNHVRKKMPEWKKLYPGVENLKIAVMGCVVNGPGESIHADIGIHLPGKTETPIAQVYIEGKPFKTLRHKDIAKSFLQILDEYLKKRFNRAD